MLIFVFWCQLLNNCPVPEFNPLTPDGPPTSTARSNASQASVSHVLLLFNHSNRYLCINRTGHLYSRRQVNFVAAIL